MEGDLMPQRPGRPQREGIHALGVEPRQIDDPGYAGTIPGNQSGYVELTSGGAETRTLADPQFRGQILDLVFVSDGGDCVVTASSPLNQTGNTVMTFADIGDHVRIVGFNNATDGWEWRQVANDGAALS